VIEQLISLGSAGMWAAVATLFTTALTATGRPGATVFLLLAVPTGLLESGLWEAHDWFFPPTHTWVLVVTGIWAVLEHAFRGEVYGDLMEALPLDQLMALLLIWLMFVGQIALGTSPADVPDLGLQMRRLIPVGPGLVLLGIAVPLNLVVGWARRQVVEVMRDLGFGGTAAVIEVVGVTGILVSVVGLPALALGIVVVIALPLVVVAIIARVGMALVDRQRRRPCDHCGHAARMEASACPRCGGALSFVRPLAPPVTAP